MFTPAKKLTVSQPRDYFAVLTKLTLQKLTFGNDSSGALVVTEDTNPSWPLKVVMQCHC